VKYSVKVVDILKIKNVHDFRMLVLAPSTLVRLVAHMFMSYTVCGSFRVVSKVMGATIWCLEVHLAFDVLANVFHIDKSCPPTMF
jgi:hypothetical protein